jgi:hypothetical protein
MKKKKSHLALVSMIYTLLESWSDTSQIESSKHPQERNYTIHT